MAQRWTGHQHCQTGRRGMMNLTRLLMLLFSGLSGTSYGASRKYHLVQLSKNWAEAQSYCREHFTDLATIENEEDSATVSAFFISGDEHVWIGLHYVETEWKWSLDNTNLYPDGNTDLGDWFSFLANNINNVEECVCYNNRMLHDSNCYNLHKFVCYDEPTEAYIGVTDMRSWWSAQSYCREKYTDLASVRSQQEQERILEQIDRDTWWVGLSRRQWQWSDQTDFIFVKWNSKNPNVHGEQCVTATLSGWHDIYCDHRHPFICSVSTKLVKFVLKTEGPVDMNDPLIQEAIRQHTEERLKKGGIQRFRLTWTKQAKRETFKKF